MSININIGARVKSRNNASKTGLTHPLQRERLSFDAGVNTAITMVHKKQFITASNGLLVRAPAKINLSLLIAGKRDDGFHEIETIMAKVNFYDELLIQKSKKSGIEVISKGPQWAPQGEENLIYKAAEMTLKDAGFPPKIKITLTKNIPAGSGLGSASSDAAATLLGLKRYLKLDISPQRMLKMAASLGNDVPFFLGEPLAFCTGKGEEKQKIGGKFNFFAVLILPDISVSTKMVYNGYKHNNDMFKRLHSQIFSHIRKNRVDLIAKMCANMLELSCFSLNKRLAELKNKIESFGTGSLCLSGSGSVMYWIVEGADRNKGRRVQRKIKGEIGCNSVIVSNNRW